MAPQVRQMQERARGLIPRQKKIYLVDTENIDFTLWERPEILRKKNTFTTRKTDRNALASVDASSATVTTSALILQTISKIFTEEKNLTFLKRFYNWATSPKNHYVWLFLTILGVVSSGLAFGMDKAIEYLSLARVKLTTLTSSAGGPVAGPILGFLVWTLIGFAYLSFAVFLTKKLGPPAAGSGIPEMKAVLSGVNVHGLLVPKTLIAKVFGLCFAIGSGLFIGKEGPFIHISSCIANFLMSRKIFKNINKNPEQRIQMLTTACASGVACNFGAPIGGVLFGIEVTAMYYSTRNYWKGFYTSVVGAILFRLLLFWVNGNPGALWQTSFKPKSYDVFEFGFFIFFGVLNGFASAFFVWVNQRVALWRKARISKKFFSLLYPQALTVSLITSVICYPWGPTILSLRGGKQLGSLFSPGDLDPVLWGSTQPLAMLAVFLVVKFFVTAVSILLPCPAGAFAPSMIIGGAFGRLVGEFLRFLFPTGFSQGEIVAGGYALAGAAAFTGGVTRTISAAVIAFELTGQLDHALAVLFATVACVAVGEQINLSLFDTLARIKDLPYFIKIGGKKVNRKLTAKDIMTKDLDSFLLHRSSTYGDVAALLNSSANLFFPLVQTLEDKDLLGVVQRGDLQHHLAKCAHHIKKDLAEHSGKSFFSIFRKLGKPKEFLSEAKQSARSLLHDAIHDEAAKDEMTVKSIAHIIKTSKKQKADETNEIEMTKMHRLEEEEDSDTDHHDETHDGTIDEKPDENIDGGPQDSAADDESGTNFENKNETHPSPSAPTLVAENHDEPADEIIETTEREKHIDSDHKIVEHTDNEDEIQPAPTPTPEPLAAKTKPKKVKRKKTIDAESGVASYAEESGPISFSDQLVDFVTSNRVTVDLSVFEMAPDLPMDLVYFYFTSLNLNIACVTQCGQLLGVITRKSVIDKGLI